MRRHKTKSTLKPLLFIVMIVAIIVMIFNSGLLVRIGLFKGNIPDDIGIDANDPRIIEKEDPSLDSNILRNAAHKVWGLITGKVEQGKIVIYTHDLTKEFGIPGFEIEISDAVTGELLETIRTDSTGHAESLSLDYRQAYRVKIKSAPYPYVLSDEEVVLEMKAELIEVQLAQQVDPLVRSYQKDESGKVVVTELFIDVPMILQKPELPNGCEVTALTSVLNFYDFPIDKVELSDQFLPKSPFYMKNGKLHGADPMKAFSGDPNDDNGWFVYTPPMVETAKEYLSSVNATHTVLDITGSTSDEIMSYVERGVPVVVWVTIELDLAKYDYGWILDGTDVYFEAPTNLHSMVIHGIVGDSLYVMDPLKGSMTYDKETLFASYESLGSRAMVVEKTQ